VNAMKIPFLKEVSWYLIVAMFVIAVCPRVDAGIAPSTVIAPSQGDRAADLEKIQRTLEMKAVKDRLEKLGLSNDEITARFGQLSDQQIHQLALQIDDLRVGKDGAIGVIIGLLVIVLLVVLILYFTGHKVIVTK
jgi:hypothetical protein